MSVHQHIMSADRYVYGPHRLTEAQAAAADALIEAVVLDDQPIDGLSRQEAKMVRVLIGARGRSVSIDALTTLIAADPLEPTTHVTIRAVKYKICAKRPDIGQHITSKRYMFGYSWTGPLDFLGGETESYGCTGA